MIQDCLVVDLADVTLSKRLQMDTNLKLQRAIESARNSELVKRQQGTIRNIVKSYEIKVVRRKTSRSSKYKDCPWCGDYRACKRSRSQLTTVVVLNVASPVISKQLAVLEQLNLLKRLQTYLVLLLATLRRIA